MNAATHEYRAKAFECVSLAEWMNNPERLAETLRFARRGSNWRNPSRRLSGRMRCLGVLTMPSRDLPEP